MNNALALELFGYLGSLLILVSMIMTSVVKLRVINLIGSAVFASYAVLIHSYPTALLNVCLVAVNVYQLVKLRNTAGKNYEVRAVSAEEGFVRWFIDKYYDDIKKYFPSFEIDDPDATEGFAVFFENRAAGIMLGKKTDDRFDILLDYTMPAFRDCSVGEYLYGIMPSCGIRHLSCRSDCLAHIEYMEKMGFVSAGDGTYLKKDLDSRDKEALSGL